MNMITFRPHSRNDISLRVRWLNNPEAIRYALDDVEHVTTAKEQVLWFDNYEKKHLAGGKIFFTILDEETPVGFMGLSNIDQVKKTAEVFILIGEDSHRGRGVGREAMTYLITFAFETLGLASLHLGVNNLNLPAINLYKKLGFSEIKKNDKETEMILFSSPKSGSDPGFK
ncbi:MAG: GNAT family N-acetyltransferase [Candidatus Parcubacteria bacterium]|nr:GNAT family N-acetyltransferase [Candidatus Parcubacteria bacterium]